MLVNNFHPSPLLFSQVRILKDFKSNDFGTADSKRVTAAFFGTADSEGLRGLFCCACRRLLSGNTAEGIIIVTQSQGLFTQRPFEWDGPEETATVGACEQNDVESLS